MVLFPDIFYFLIKLIICLCNLAQPATPAPESQTICSIKPKNVQDLMTDSG